MNDNQSGILLLIIRIICILLVISVIILIGIMPFLVVIHALITIGPLEFVKKYHIEQAVLAILLFAGVVALVVGKFQERFK